MSKKILYYSTDKLYKVTKNRISKNNLLILSLIVTAILATISIICFNESVLIGSKESLIKYNEVGNVEYKILLKDYDYIKKHYESGYMESGMQYVANFIKTVNVKFNYEIHATDELNFSNDYKVVSELQITERNDPSKVLYSKKDDLVPVKKINKKDDSFVINEEVDIDYEKYNNIVNEYKKDGQGLIVSSNLKLTLETNTNGKTDSAKLVKGNKLQIVIPLSEVTLNLDTDEINNTASLEATRGFINIKNMLVFIVFIFSSVLTVASLILDYNIYSKYIDKNPYKIKINSILRNYDRLIVTGNINIDESKYSNIIYPKSFKEMVDAAQNLEVPIMHYEVIKDEKSIFIVVKGDTLFKYRVTKAYLDNKNNKDEELDII